VRSIAAFDDAARRVMVIAIRRTARSSRPRELQIARE
jgi:hypothetical protein